MGQKIADLIAYLDQIAPLKDQSDWDNSGFLVGDKNKSVEKIMVALDATSEVIEEAISQKCQLLITHHPLIFKGLKQITADDFIGKRVMKLISHDLGLYSMHTNWDLANGGLKDYYAKALGLKQCTVLTEEKQEKLYKLVVFVPRSHILKVREAVLSSGAGHIGQYSHCSFTTEGTGSFMPLKGTTPFVGVEGKLEEVEEIRLETIVKGTQLNEVIAKMKEAHPYEEVAFDVIPLLNSIGKGPGAIGELDQPMTLEQLCSTLNGLGNPVRKTVLGHERLIKRVAICPGSGMDLIQSAVRAKVDVYITGDIKYHDALDSKEKGINLIDIGHYETEISYLDEMIRVLEPIQTLGCQVVKTTIEANPFTYLS